MTMFRSGLALLAFAVASTGARSAPGTADPLDATVRNLKAQQPGTVDAYVLVAALDTDPVFGREAREAGRVLERRFDAQGRTIVLAGDEGEHGSDGAGTPGNLERALSHVAAAMDPREDVLVLYSTSHGSPNAGLNYKSAAGRGVISPAHLAETMKKYGLRNRLIILQACYSGQFVPVLASPTTVIATAASSMRPSFGCSPGNDWTFFGHALVNLAMRKPEPFQRQFRRAFVAINAWERQLGMPSSNPQISVGSETARWLTALDSRAPAGETQPVGKPPAEIAN